MQLTIGQIVEGKITGITNFGVFADLGEGKTGTDDDSTASLAAMSGMKIFGMVIRRSLLKETGRFNAALEGSQNREFLTLFWSCFQACF